MKALFYLLFLLTPSSILAADVISFDDFKKLSVEEQEKLIQEASPATRQKPQQIHSRSLEIIRWGEQGWRYRLEDRLLMKKGLYALVDFFQTEEECLEIRARYAAAESEKASPQMLEAIEKRCREESEAAREHYFKVVRPLLVTLAPSAEALKLASESQPMTRDLVAKYMGPTISPQNPPHIGKSEKNEAEKYANHLMEKLKKLPRITPSQLESEIAAVAEEPRHK